MLRRWRVTPSIDLLGSASIEHRMRPRSVVIVDPAADPGPGLGADFEGLKIDAFVLETAPQPLDHDVVHPPTSAVHGDLHAGVLQDLREGHARELAAWVREVGLPLTANAVVHRQNLDHLQDIIALADSVDTHRLEIAHVQYYGWALKNRAALMPTRQQVEKANQVAAEARKAYEGRLVIDYVVPDYYARRPKRCMDGWGNQFFAVSPGGLVLPCHAAETITGMTFSSVRDRSLSWIWRNDEAFQRFRGIDWLPEPCHSCEYRYRDLGGCRCQAFAFTGDASATDPVCKLSPHHATLLALAEAEAQSGELGFTHRR